MDQPFSSTRAHARQRIARLLPLLLLAPGVSSCGLLKPPAARLTPPMPVQAPMRKQVLQGYMPFGSIGWIGNDKVIFHGLPVKSKTGKNSLYLWNLQDRPRILLSRSHSSCTVDDQIQTLQLNGKNQNRSVRLRAPDFKPQPQPPSKPVGPGIQDPVSCKWISRPTPLIQHIWLPLRQGEGFLDFGKRDGEGNSINKVIRLSKDLRTRTDTGISMPNPTAPMAVYAAHDGTYLVYDMHQSHTDKQRWIEAKNRTIWRLNDQHRGQALQIPAGPWVGISTGTIAFHPARPGVLITSNNFARSGIAGGAGLYLLRPGAPAQRLEQGLVQEAAVSPDGCRVAYGFRPRLDTGIPEGGPRLVVLDLCGAIPSTRR